MSVKTQVWARAYTDSRLFQQTRIAITQTEIAKILSGGGVGGIEKTGVLYAAGGVAIVPADPTKVLSVSNSALVATSTRSVLMKHWKKLGREGYCKLLPGSNASEETFSERTPITLGQPL